MIKFPVRLHDYSSVVAVRLPKYHGGSAKMYIREVAKGITEYHKPIECGISGHTDTGKEIPINNVGKWLFGVPGYMGHIRVSNHEGTTALIEYPANSPDIVDQLVAKIKQQVEKK